MSQVIGQPLHLEDARFLVRAARDLGNGVIGHVGRNGDFAPLPLSGAQTLANEFEELN